MLIQTSVGSPANQAGGSTPNLRSGKLGDTIASELHSKYYEQTYNKNSFFVANQAVTTTSAAPFGLQTTYLGLCLSNPLGSGVNLVLGKCSFMQSVIQSSNVEAYAIATGFNATTNVTHTIQQAPVTCKVGSGATANGLADISATLPTAPFYTVFVGTAGTTGSDPTMGLIDLEGSIILMPGAYACWVTPAQQSVNGMWFSFAWEEVAV